MVVTVAINDGMTGAVQRRTTTVMTSSATASADDNPMGGPRDSNSNSGNNHHNHSHEIELQPLTRSVVDEDDIDDFSRDDFSRDTTDPLPHKAVVLEPPKDFWEWLDRWLYPPHVPRSCQLLRRENLAVPLCYLLVGLLQGFSGPLVQVLPLDLHATEAQQTTLSAIRSIPSSFKLVFGFMSDNLPILGYRRKPYMFVGWLTASCSMLGILLTSNLAIPPRNSGCFHAPHSSATNAVDPADHARSIPPDAPSIAFLSVALLIFGMGFWLADVMGDSIVAEKAKLEPPSARGSVQSSCYSYRFFGMMIAAPLSTFLYATYGPYSVILVLAILPLTILPAVWVLYEDSEREIPSTRSQCTEIWNTVCSRAVWQPMAFVYLFNVMQVSNAAWREFLVTVLHFTSCQLNMILIASYVLIYLGILSYKYLLITWSWRNVYVICTLLNGCFSILQVLLIKGITFGLNPFLFALGDDAFMEFISGVQFLPTTIMMVHLCPTGSEGASYAMFTTVNNSALNLSSAISTMLLRIWDVSATTLHEGKLSGLTRLTIFTTAIQTAAIGFVWMLPHYKEDLQALQGESQKSTWGGSLFLVITFGSILYAFSVCMMNVFFPGWMGES